MKKELVIAAKFDTSDFDKSVETMQKKLKDLYAPADIIRAQTMTQNAATNTRLGANGMNNLDGASGEAFKKATQSAKRELDQLINTQVKSQNDLGKGIAKQLDTLEKLRSTQKFLNEGTKEELKIKKEIADIEAKTAGMREQYKNRDSVINQMIDTKEKNAPKGVERLVNSYQEGGVGGVASEANKMIKGAPGGYAGFIGDGLGAAGAVLSAAAPLYRDYTRTGVETAQAQGSAVQNTVGKDLGNVYNNRSSFDNIFSDERKRAAEKAMTAYKGGRTADVLGMGGMALGTAGAAVGAFAGGPIGAGVVGGAAAAGAGLYNMVTNQRSRDAVLSMIPGSIGDKYQGRYDADRAKGYGEDFRSTYEAEQEKNPVKKYAADEFERNMGRNVQTERQLGLTNDQFAGDKGYLKNITDKGFTHDMGINASKDIISAGGSTTMARDSGFSLQMQRMGVTNSADVLGKLSGGMQNPESTKRATIAIMSEAMKIGLDQSDFSEENRRFIGAAASVIGKSGASGEKDQDRISAMLSQFMGERTNQGVASAQNAYEATQERDSQVGGRRGTLRMVAAMKDPVLNKLGQQDTSELLGIRPDQLNENNPEVASFARKAGVSSEELLKSVNKMNKAGRYELPGQAKEVDAASAKINDYIKTKGITKEEFGEQAMAGKLPFEQMANLGDLEKAKRRTDSSKYDVHSSLAQSMEDIDGNEQVKAPEKSFGKTLKDSVESMLTSTPRREDKFIAGQAGDSEVVRKNFNDMSGELDKAAESASKMTTAVREMAIEFSHAIEQAEKNNNPAPMDALIKKQSQMGSQNQPQAAKGRQ